MPFLKYKKWQAMKNLTKSINQKKELVLKKKVVSNLQIASKSSYQLTTLSSSII